MKSTARYFAVEIDEDKIQHPIDLDPPHGAVVFHGPRWDEAARKELSGGRKSYRTPARPMYIVIAWEGMSGQVGRVLDWLEQSDIPVTRYAEMLDV